MISLTETLKIWTSIEDMTDGELILANVNLGSLVESWLMLFYTIYYKDNIKNLKYKHLVKNGKTEKETYKKIESEIKRKSENEKALKKELVKLRINMEKIIKKPNDLSFNQLIEYSKTNILEGNKKMIDWLEGIQNKRNAVHSFNDKEIGNQKEFLTDLSEYLNFIKYIVDHLPPIRDIVSDYEIENYHP